MNIPEIEQSSNDEILKFQNAKLIDLLSYLNKNSAFYQKKFANENINISSIKTISDLQKISLTTKDDLQQYNDDFICVDKSKIVDFVTTSGTLGKPVTFALTDKDLDRLAYNEAISFACAGVSENDVVQLMTTMDRRFMAGLAYFFSVSKTKPEFGDIVNFDYYIQTLNDQTIYGEGEKPTKEYAIDQENLFSGLRDGLKLMKAGETVTFLFPSYKAFGYYGDKDRIGTNIPIKTTVTLHSIRKQDSIN